MHRYKYIYAAISLLLLVACGNNKFDVDVSGIDAKVSVKRLDVDMFSLNPDVMDKDIPLLQKNYGSFLDLVSTQVLQISSPSDSMYASQLHGFITHPDWRRVSDEVQRQYAEITDIEVQLSDLFKHYLYYYPNKKTPTVYTYISGFNYSVITDEHNVGIGLDMYLGDGCEYYKRAKINRYQQYNMHKGRIAVDVAKAWAMQQYTFNDSIDDLVSNMIYNGQVMYFVYAMLPQVADSTKFGYSTMQWNWCTAYEQNMWTHMVEDNRLFETNRIEIAKFVNDAPFTAPFHNNSAPRAGVYIGWRIVMSYMEKNKNVTLPQLMQMRNYHQILNMSKYKP